MTRKLPIPEEGEGEGEEEGEGERQTVQTLNAHGYRHWPNAFFSHIVQAIH